VWPGLTAAQQLEKRGHQVVVVEGHARPGGRVYTKKMEARIGFPPTLYPSHTMLDEDLPAVCLVPTAIRFCKQSCLHCHEQTNHDAAA